MVAAGVSSEHAEDKRREDIRDELGVYTPTENTKFRSVAAQTEIQVLGHRDLLLPFQRPRPPTFAFSYSPIDADDARMLFSLATTSRDNRRRARWWLVEVEVCACETVVRACYGMAVLDVYRAGRPYPLASLNVGGSDESSSRTGGHLGVCRSCDFCRASATSNRRSASKQQHLHSTAVPKRKFPLAVPPQVLWILVSTLPGLVSCLLSRCDASKPLLRDFINQLMSCRTQL
ncbi:hypothetical protein DFH11DRAFT_1058624 [Phellopilus nigrolimitatus]|nr:hypothetical protein DFH11DRAFT_1058624 [Phellopilus nigrolimitatus]